MQTPRPLPNSNLRHQFQEDRLSTASNGTILTLCFDRLDRDLSVAREAISNADHFTTNDALGHAQDLLSELAGMLDTGAWEHANSLLTVYDYLLRLLAKANILKDDALVAEAQRLVAEIGDAFRQAAGTATPAAPAATAAASAFETGADRPRFSIQA